MGSHGDRQPGRQVLNRPIDDQHAHWAPVDRRPALVPMRCDAIVRLVSQGPGAVTSPAPFAIFDGTTVAPKMKAHSAAPRSRRARGRVRAKRLARQKPLRRLDRPESMGPRRDLGEADGAYQLRPDRGLVERDGERLQEPPRQVLAPGQRHRDQQPAHGPVTLQAGDPRQHHRPVRGPTPRSRVEDV